MDVFQVFECQKYKMAGSFVIRPGIIIDQSPLGYLHRPGVRFNNNLPLEKEKDKRQYIDLFDFILPVSLIDLSFPSYTGAIFALS